MTDYPLDTLHEDYAIVPASEPSAKVGEYDPYERIEEEVAKGAGGEDIWQDAVSLGITISDHDDDNYYKLGRLAASVGKKYGEDRFGLFCDAIKKSKKTTGERRQLWNFWGADLIAQFRAFPDIRYTHFRCGMRVGQSLEDPNAAYRFMMDAVEEEWSVGRAEVEAAQRMGKSVSPRKIAEGSAKVLAVKGKKVTLEISNEAIQQTLATLQADGKEFLMRLFESELPPAESKAGEQTDAAAQAI